MPSRNRSSTASNLTRHGRLLREPCRAFDDVDPSPGSRVAAWRLVARVFEASAGEGHAASRLSLACGVPPSETGRLTASQQHASLDGVAAALSEGFATGLASAPRTSRRGQREWIDAFLPTSGSTCRVLTALDRSPEAFYAPWSGLDLANPPAWWEGLTAEAWAELLEDEPEISATFASSAPIRCCPRRGACRWSSRITWKLQSARPGRMASPSTSCWSGRRAARATTFLAACKSMAANISWTTHRQATHANTVQGQCRGFPRCLAEGRLAGNIGAGYLRGVPRCPEGDAPKAPSRRTRGANWETSITLPGPGRYELLAFLSPGSSIEGLRFWCSRWRERQRRPAIPARPGSPARTLSGRGRGRRLVSGRPSFQANDACGKRGERNLPHLPVL